MYAYHSFVHSITCLQSDKHKISQLIQLDKSTPKKRSILFQVDLSGDSDNNYNKNSNKTNNNIMFES